MTKSKEMKTILNFVETNHPDLTGNVKQGFIDWIMNSPDYKEAILNGTPLPEPEEETPEEIEEFLKWINSPENARAKEVMIRRISKGHDPKCSCCGSNHELEIVKKRT